jgi:hypothetical protein
MIGLAGAHRTGKTTLARECARVMDLPFVETNVSGIFESLGLDPAQPMDIQTRLIVQSVILKVCIEKWSGYKGVFLSDRTPIDLLTYLMAEIRGDTLDQTGEQLMAKYFADCINATSRYFGLVILVQPGIPLVAAPGKARMSPGYIEHYNALMSGILVRKELIPQVVFMSRDTLDLNDRISVVSLAYKRMIKKDVQLREVAAAIH